MWNILFVQQFHFALHLFGALVFFSAGWLYFDAYNKTSKYLIPRIAGFFILSIANIFQAIQVDFILESATSESILTNFAHLLLPFMGYFLIFASFPREIIQKKPIYRNAFAVFNPLHYLLSWLRPIASFGVARMYFINVAEGLEWHLLLPSLSFGLISLAELIHSIIDLLSSSSNFFISSWFSPFGFFWKIEHCFFLLGFLILFRWVFWYLLKSLEVQMVFISITCVVVLNVLSTTAFTYHLYNSLTKEIARQQTESVKVFSYSIESKKKESLADARFISLDPRLIAAITTNNNKDALAVASEFAQSRNIRHLLILDPKGVQLIQKSEDNIFHDLAPFVYNINLSRKNIESTSLIKFREFLTTVVHISSSVPIVNNGELLGMVLITTPLDNTLLTGIQYDTGFQGALYGDNQLFASSLSQSNTLIGVLETNQNIINRVLKEGSIFEGQTTLNQTQYLGTYLPLKDGNSLPIGMMFVGKPIGEILSLIALAIRGTFFLSGILLLLSVLPAIYVARYIIMQFK